ncbi:hypothetical protein AUJ17_03165 [Candidatus Micrarchaeota archaeon CG1_02_47_40]|nr:MAG: hypothetical protein AUJ17_03165 [Candidatus Micrarchaeota archaeon CG1_02_47_40]
MFVRKCCKAPSKVYLKGNAQKMAWERVKKIILKRVWGCGELFAGAMSLRFGIKWGKKERFINVC